MWHVLKNGIEQQRTGDQLAALAYVMGETSPHMTVAQAIADGWEITTQPRQ